MGTVEIELPILHENQVKVVEERGRYNVLSMGRRWGKTMLLLSLLLDGPGPCALDGYPVAWFAGTSKVYDEVWRLACEVCAPIIKHKDSQQKRLELVTGGVIEFWSLHRGDDGGCGRGRKYARVVIDEAAYVKNLAEIYTKAIRPTLIDYRGDVWMISTPCGKLNDFYDFWQRGLPKNRADDPEWRCWQMPSHANPLLAREELDDLAREYRGRPLAYRQEILAEFVDDAGAVFDLGWFRSGKLPRMDRCYQAWDLAVTEKELERGDWSVGACGGLDPAKRFWAMDQVRGQWNSGDLVEQIIAFANRHHPMAVFLEGGPIGKTVLPYLERRMRERKQWHRVVLVPPIHDKVTRATGLVGLAANGVFYRPDPAPDWWADLAAELVSFPGGRTDDQVDAWAHLANQATDMRESLPAPPEDDPTPEEVVEAEIQQYHRDMQAQIRRLKRAKAKKRRART